MNGSPSRRRVHPVRQAPVAAVVLLSLLAAPQAAHAAPATWADWWLPTNHSQHGSEMDWLFNVIFWITMVIFVVVEVVLVYFCIKYRFRPDKRKGIFSHGNTRLEMAWTLAPAVILIWISLATKRVWDEYRFGNAAEANDRAQVLVVGEQFKWNVVYPGPDGKLGKYLAYPKPTDPQYNFKPADQAAKDVVNELRDNPLGQSVDKADPNDAGKDDDYSRQPGRPLIVPQDQPLEIVLTAKDVLHSFFLPNFRVKLDAVPGLRGLIYFTAKDPSTAEASIENVPAGKQIWLDHDVPTAVLHGIPKTFKIFDPNDKQKNLARRRVWLQSLESLEDVARKRLLREKVAAEQIVGERLAAEVWKVRQDLKALGIEQVTYVDRPFEIVCEELCGLAHYTMRGDMIVVSRQQYDDFQNREALAAGAKSKPSQSTPATKPPATQAADDPATAPSAEPATQPAADTQPATEPATAPTAEPATAPTTEPAPPSPTTEAAPPTDSPKPEPEAPASTEPAEPAKPPEPPPSEQPPSEQPAPVPPSEAPASESPPAPAEGSPPAPGATAGQ